METIARTKVLGLIKSANGRFITARFKKLDGSIRILNGRLGVTKYAKGMCSKVEKPWNDYVVIFDAQLREYRTLNLGTLSALRVDGVTYIVS